MTKKHGILKISALAALLFSASVLVAHANAWEVGSLA